MPTRWKSCLFVVLWACLALSDAASADDPWELWPEAQLFVGLSPRTRVLLNAAYVKGKESDERSLDAAAYLDISFLPVGPRRRRSLRTEDWQRGRYLWARLPTDGHPPRDLTPERHLDGDQRLLLRRSHGSRRPADLLLEASSSITRERPAAIVCPSGRS
jgi:hypothetical protein